MSEAQPAGTPADDAVKEEKTGDEEERQEETNEEKEVENGPPAQEIKEEKTGDEEEMNEEKEVENGPPVEELIPPSQPRQPDEAPAGAESEEEDGALTRSSFSHMLCLA